MTLLVRFEHIMLLGSLHWMCFRRMRLVWCISRSAGFCIRCLMCQRVVDLADKSGDLEAKFDGVVMKGRLYLKRERFLHVLHED